jgi:hypothetical protein
MEKIIVRKISEQFCQYQETEQPHLASNYWTHKDNYTCLFLALVAKAE